MNISTNLSSMNQTGVQPSEQQSGRLSVQNTPIVENTTLASLAKGTIFQGEILQVQGNQVRLQVGSQILNALLDQGAQVDKGAQLFFLVKESASNKITLQTISGNGGQSSHVLSGVLEAAALPVTARNIAAVKEMMNHGMPIDKNAMGEMGKILNQFQNANVETIVGLKSHDLPITEANISQYEAYQSAEGKVPQQLQQFVEQLQQGINHIGTPEQAMEFRNILMGIHQAIVGGETSIRTGVAGPMELEQQNPLAMEQSIEMSEMSGMDTKESAQRDNGPVQGAMQDMTGQQPVLKETLQTQNMVEYIKSELQETLGKIEKEIGNRYFLTPEQLSKDGKKAVDELYTKLSGTMDKIIQLLEENGQSGTKLMNSAGDLKNNMNFMQDFNQVASYVQLPMKLNGSEQTGELYVMSRKRKKMQQGETLTAFLHLDMEYLGATDVRVALKNDKITTKFNLDNDASMRLVEAHLGELKERLEKMGYSAVLTVDEIQDKKVPFQEILEVDKPKKQVRKYSFDVEI